MRLARGRFDANAGGDTNHHHLGHTLRFQKGAEIGVGEQVLGRWVRLQRQALSAGDTGAVLDADERAELERLRRENAELRLDREFLKKAAAFFVSEHNR